MKITTVFALCAGLVSVTACATVTKGTGDDVSFVSSPEGAKVTTDDLNGKEQDQSCRTPCTMELNRKWTYDVTFELDGYQTLKARLEPRFSGDGAAGMAGNLLLGGVIGAAVDASTGAMNDLEPNPLAVVLDPIKNIEVTEEASESEPQS